MNRFYDLSRLIRYHILKMSTLAGSGHPTSSLSAADLMTALFFGGFFHFDFKNPDNLANDRLIFSKGHATPLFYALYAVAGAIKSSELDTYRQLGSRLEGHATMRFPYAEAATGSLGQGLSAGVGMALAIKKKFEARSTKSEINPEVSNFDIRISDFPKVFTLLGDGELAEGAVWEAVNLASYYKLDNLIAIVDVNRLGQSGETMLGWEAEKYEKRFEAFGWKTIVIDGHDYREITQAFKQVSLRTASEAPPMAGRGGPERAKRVEWDSSEVKELSKPLVIIAKTVKGRGISFLENRENWHGKPLSSDQFKQAVKELGKIDFKLRGKVGKPSVLPPFSPKLLKLPRLLKTNYKIGEEIATRKAYGTALARLGQIFPSVVSLDGDVSNSTYSEIFKARFPNRFFEMFIAEQNMVGAATGLSRLGFIPFVSTFAAFLTRAYDQIRMAAVSRANIKFCGSHGGVSIGEDGPSQMGLEDISMFRSVYNSVVLYPADAVATEKLVEEMIKRDGICYLRTTRPPTLVIYDNKEEFPIGGCKIHRIAGMPKNTPEAPTRSAGRGGPDSIGDSSRVKGLKIIIIAAGITLFEALKAQQQLARQETEAIVVDCYSIKPIDEKTLKQLVLAASPKPHTLNPIPYIITVEDHWFDGGLGDAVLNVFHDDPKVRIQKLAVCKMPRSGKPEELLDYEKITAAAIVEQVCKSLFEKYVL